MSSSSDLKLIEYHLNHGYANYATITVYVEMFKFLKFT